MPLAFVLSFGEGLQFQQNADLFTDYCSGQGYVSLGLVSCSYIEKEGRTLVLNLLLCLSRLHPCLYGLLEEKLLIGFPLLRGEKWQLCLWPQFLFEFMFFPSFKAIKKECGGRHYIPKTELPSRQSLPFGSHHRG